MIFFESYFEDLTLSADNFSSEKIKNEFLKNINLNTMNYLKSNQKDKTELELSKKIQIKGKMLFKF